MKLLFVVLVFTLLGSDFAASAATVTTGAGARPESIAVAPDGGLILSSLTKRTIFRAAKGETQAKPWIDLSADGDIKIVGVLSDAPTNTLWACEDGPFTVPGGASFGALLSFDLKSGALKSRWKLPRDTSMCNDIAVGPDHAAYVSDTFNGIIWRVVPGTNNGTVFSDHRALAGINGLAFFDGVLYANSTSSYTIWRVPVDANGKAGNPVNIWTDAPIKSPDGMRAANGHLFLAENSVGRISMLTIDGETAHVTVLQTGLNMPTAVEPAGDVLWLDEMGDDKAVSVPMPH